METKEKEEAVEIPREIRAICETIAGVIKGLKLKPGETKREGIKNYLLKLHLNGLITFNLKTLENRE